MLTIHLESGAIKEHFWQTHDMSLTREGLVNNMNILAHSNNTRRLETLEAVYIREKSPNINIQMNLVNKIACYNGDANASRSGNSSLTSTLTQAEV